MSPFAARGRARPATAGGSWLTAGWRRGLAIEEIAVAATVLSKNFASDVGRWWGKSRRDLGSQKVAESETWRVEEAYWAQNLTGSGLDLEPETEVTKLRMARRT